MEEKIKFIGKFFGGIRRDDKSKIAGAASNIEELDIFSNADWFQAEQIMTSDTLPAASEVYAFTADNDDTVWGYGKKTGANDEVRIFKVTTGGADNPGAWATQATSSDTTNKAYLPSPIQYFRQDESGNDFIYYLTNASGTVRIARYDITNSTEDMYQSAAWVTKGTPDADSELEGLDGSFDRCFMKVMFGELYISNGQFIAKVDKDGVFTKKAFTLPNGWEAVDIVPVSDVALILARNINTEINESRGFWWDLTATTQVDDSFNLPVGGPQWVVNFRERIIMACAHNNILKFFTLAGAFPGAQPQEMQGVTLSNVAAATATQPISAPKMISTKDNVLYFGLNKTDKTGVYALGQLDDNKPFALILSKRYATSDYSSHSPTALLVHGPNYYGAYTDGAQKATRCESNNSPTRSSNAVYESIWIDDEDPLVDKSIPHIYVSTYPLAASTAVACSVDSDYSGSYTAITRPDGTSMNTTSDVLGFFEAFLADKKVVKVKLALTSSTTNSPKVTGIGVEMTVAKKPAFK